MYSMNDYSKSKRIPPKSFYDYTLPNKSESNAMGAQQGKSSLISQKKS